MKLELLNGGQRRPIGNNRRVDMNHYYWTDWYAGWGWFLWIGVWFLMFSSIGNWGYTYRVHRKYDEQPRKEALDILKQRYARGDISREEYGKMKSEISDELRVQPSKNLTQTVPQN